MQEEIILNCGDAEVTVLKPGSPVYQGTRFIHAGFIAQVKYKGISFCQPEQVRLERLTSYGSGLCCEYKITEPEEDAVVGEPYLKPGIGILIREHEKWRYMDQYTFTPLDTQVSCDAHSAKFVTQSPIINGYGYDEMRVVSVSENSVVLQIQLQNTGTKPISLLEYSHNFVALENLPVGNKYHLDLPGVKNIETTEAQTGLLATVSGVTWAAAPEKPFYKEFHDLADNQTYSWKLTHDDTRASIAEYVDFQPVRITVWGVEHCICAEVFHALKLLPGEKCEWTRRWELEA